MAQGADDRVNMSPVAEEFKRIEERIGGTETSLRAEIRKGGVSVDSVRQR